MVGVGERGARAGGRACRGMLRVYCQRSHESAHAREGEGERDRDSVGSWATMPYGVLEKEYAPAKRRQDPSRGSVLPDAGRERHTFHDNDQKLEGVEAREGGQGIKK